jgi:hypothetical protein
VALADRAGAVLIPTSLPILRASLARGLSEVLAPLTKAAIEVLAAAVDV